MDTHAPGSRSTAAPPARRAAANGQVPWVAAALAVTGVAAAAVWIGPTAAALTAAVAVAGLAWRAQMPPAIPDGEPAAGAPPVPGMDASTSPLASVLDTTLFYRPLRSLPELHLRGIEAELRWRLPGGEPLPPLAWPQTLAPDTAAALLDAWLSAALPQFARWLPDLRERGGATLWLRLPAAWGALPTFGSRLTQALADAGLDPSCLVLRVPLQAQGRQARLPQAVLDLQSQGVTLAVDAFGAGSASLTHLDRLPVRTVCLAPSFVERAGPTTPQRWVVESTAKLAASMGMSTLAEGITQDSQVLALAVLGCDLGVGEVCGPWREASDAASGWSTSSTVRAA